MFIIYFHKVFKKSKIIKITYNIGFFGELFTFNNSQRSWKEIGIQSATITHRPLVSGVSVTKKMDAFQNQFQNT